MCLKLKFEIKIEQLTLKLKEGIHVYQLDKQGCDEYTDT